MLEANNGAGAVADSSLATTTSAPSLGDEPEDDEDEGVADGARAVLLFNFEVPLDFLVFDLIFGADGATADVSISEKRTEESRSMSILIAYRIDPHLQFPVANRGLVVSFVESSN